MWAENRKRVVQLGVTGWLVVHIPFALEVGLVVTTTMVDIDIACGKDVMIL